MIYLFLKRCHNVNSTPREVTVSVIADTPTSVNGIPSLGRTNLRRQLHGTSSLTIHNTASLSLEEFNKLINSIQNLQQLQRDSQLTNQPLPPSYESVARTTSYCSLR